MPSPDAISFTDLTPELDLLADGPPHLVDRADLEQVAGADLRHAG